MTAWLDSSEQEYEAYDDSGEDYLDSGEDYGEASRAERLRRARARRAREQRQQNARTRAGAAGPARRGVAPPSQQRTAAAIRTLDLESKVADDSLRSAISAQGRQIARNQWATAAGVVVGVGMKALGGPDNPWLAAAVSSVPLLIVDPGQRKGTGLERFITDPRVIGGAAVVGLTFLGENSKRLSRLSHQVNVQSPGVMRPGESDMFIGEVRDRLGSRVNVPVSWTSSNTEVATINPTTGEVVAVKPGFTQITLTVDNDTHFYRLKVEAPAGQTGQVQAGPDATPPAVLEGSAPGKKR